MSSRILYYFPIVHSQSDMGALGESIRKVTMEKLGARVWRQKVTLVERFWCNIEGAIDSLSLPYAHTRVYQDGLPVCDKEAEIISDIAKMGSPNHLLLVRLREKGATIMGTESADLLIEEHRLIKKVLEAGDAKRAFQIESSQKAASDLLLKKRDSFIADRIAGTLQVGETGVLFLGMLHDLSCFLPADIQVHYPINRPLHIRKK